MLFSSERAKEKDPLGTLSKRTAAEAAAKKQANNEAKAKEDARKEANKDLSAAESAAKEAEDALAEAKKAATNSNNSDTKDALTEAETAATAARAEATKAKAFADGITSATTVNEAEGAAEETKEASDIAIFHKDATLDAIRKATGARQRKKTAINAAKKISEAQINEVINDPTLTDVQRTTKVLQFKQQINAMPNSNTKKMLLTKLEKKRREFEIY
jgi:colicin import membrane protein